MGKQYIIISYDAVGYWAIEGIYDNFENAQNDFLENIRALNEKIILLNIQKEKEYQIPDFFKKFGPNDIDEEFKPNVKLSYSNQSFTIEILEVEKNKFLKSINSWYETDEDMNE